MKSIFEIVERRGERGAYPLNENHWSNVLAWLIDEEETGKLANEILGLLAPETVSLKPIRIERETAYRVSSQQRLIDIEVTFDGGIRLFIDVKTDPSYQDKAQIDDQLSLLNKGEYHTLIAPLNLTRLVDDSSLASTYVLTWKKFASECERLLESQEQDGLIKIILSGVVEYWSNYVSTPFEQMVMTIIEEQKWTAFYPDDFKDVFIARFNDVWDAWVEERPETGNGNPHQYLLLCLSSLANRKNGYRLVKTGNTRKPKPENWGYPKIYELGIVNEDE